MAIPPLLHTHTSATFGPTHLIGLGVLADKRLVVGGEGGSVVVDVQHSHVDGHAADLPRVVWWTNRKSVSVCVKCMKTNDYLTFINPSPGSDR